MPVDGVVGDGEEALMRAGGAFDAGFVTDAGDPFVGAGGGVAGSAGAAAVEAAGVDVVAAAEEIAEQGDFGGGRGAVIQGWGLRERHDDTV